MSALQGLMDRAAIAEVVAGLAHTQDDQDWTALRQLFADVVRLDLSTHYYGNPPMQVPAAELVELARRTREGFDATHHSATDLLIQVSGDEAECRAHVVAYHHISAEPGAPDYCTMRGFWRLLLRRSGERWLIHHWTVARTAPWEGSPEIYDHAARP
ncbi:nuclear transport factor 2 family protein [Kribbella sp. NPDC026611]|uniref:nuclear transport factor 2 family protein n=1 Tax=Kribbella sp. NPDC026611 TaxID=3154911 RepID=UPI0033E97D12